MQRRSAFTLAFLAAFACSQAPAYSQDTSTPAPATPTPAPVPLEEVALRAQEVIALLDEVEDRMQARPAIEEIRAQLPVWMSRVGELRTEAVRVLGADPSPQALDAIEGPSDAASKQLDRWRDLLTETGRELEIFLGRLGEIRRTWLATRDAARRANAPAAIVERIKDTVTKVDETGKQLGERRDDLLLLQDQVAKLLEQNDHVRRDIKRMRAEIMSQLGERNAPRVWEIRWADVTAVSLAADDPNSLTRQLAVLRDYVVANVAYIAFHVAVFVGLIPLLMRVRKRIPTWVERNPQVTRAMPVVALPVSSALLASILTTLWIYPAAPRVFANLLALISLVPTVRILRRLVDRTFLPVIHTLAAFFVLDRLRRLVDLPQETLQVLFILQMGISICAVFFLVSTGRLSLTGHTGGAIVPRIIEYVGRTLIAIFTVSLIIACLGYLRLAEWLAGGFLSSGYVAIGLYATYRVAQGVVAYGVRSDLGRKLRMSQHPVVERRLNLGLRWIAVAAWLLTMLLIFDLLEVATGALGAAMNASFEVGEIRLSFGSILAFPVTVWLAFTLSRFMRFVLAEDVYPRFPLARGVPYAVSTLVHYTILLFGFFLAFAAMGLDLNRFTILAGAFGVGIGFGMQNIVNNFVSGLILLFERPIQVGDTVQMGDLVGEVVRIGIRSSAVRTWQGAEVIVPNASFISEAVTNWTLSDRMRRIEINVGIAYGTDPERVLALLTEVATNHPLVLTEPAPVSLFLGFGDSALNFELRVWTNRFEEWVRIRSQLNVAVNAALRDAGISIPFPQRDVHLAALEAVDVRIVDTKDPRSSGSSD